MAASIKIMTVPKDGETKDGFEITISRDLIDYLQTVKNLLTDMPDAESIPCPNTSKEHAVFIRDHLIYMGDNWAAGANRSCVPLDSTDYSEEELERSQRIQDWTFEKIKKTHEGHPNFEPFYPLYETAEFLGYTQLQHLISKYVAEYGIKGKDKHEIRRLLNIENDFTPEEEAEIEKSNAWIYAE